MKSLFKETTVTIIKPTNQVKDIFDEIELEGKNVVGKVIPPTKEELAKKAEEAKLIARIKAEVLASIKIPTMPPPEVKKEEKEVEEPEKEEVEVEDDTDDETEMKMEEMCAEMEKMKAMMEDHHKKMKEMVDNAGPVFIPAAPIIPNWSDKNNNILWAKDGQMKWLSPPVSSQAYTTSNVTTTRTLDANDTSLDELADLVSSLIVDLQTAGVLK